ncbi:MAG: hypothetical protein K1X71_11275 [Pirellulales bacterium]|nr:hypothetical protein [Pirellulales bacterium]
MRLRQFNQQGIEAFRRFLAECRQTPATLVPTALLEDDSMTELVRPSIEVAPRQFANKREAAEYLTALLAPLPAHEVEANAGLWTWLTLFYFEGVCPASDNRRIVKNDYRYIYEPNNTRHYYRHLLCIAWRILQIAPVYNRLFLVGPVSKLEKSTEEVMKRLFLTRIPCIFEVIDRLYWDPVTGRQRRRIVDTKPQRGDLRHRLPAMIRQLEKTYDLQSLSADQLIELLGSEFQPPQAEPMALAS